MTLSDEAIILYQLTRQYWEFWGPYLKTNYEKDFTFFYIEPNTELRKLSESVYAFYIKPKNIVSSYTAKYSDKSHKSETLEIKAILFDVKDLNI